MKRIASIVVLMVALLLTGCNFTGLKIVTGSGKLVEETRQVSGFDSIDMSGSGDIIITQGDQEGVKIEAEENLMPYIRTEVRGHTLHIYIDHTDLLTINTSRPMRFYVSMKDVAGLDLSGSGSISSDQISTNDLDIKISGSGDVEIDNLKADSVTLDISGSGKCNFKGLAASQNIDISGSGRCDNSELKSRDVKIDVSGSGNITVNAEDTLDVNISGSGDITYSGNPKVTQDISGSGKLTSN
ncbi:MAG: head GIN domain-containing protein [Anaerolineaceae bacterium]